MFERLAHEHEPRSRSRLRERLIEGHRRLAMSVIARLVAAGVIGGEAGEPLEDLSQVALLGLVQAVDRFDPAAGVRFSTFATITVHGCVIRHLRDRGSMLRLPRRHQEVAAAARRATGTLSAELGHSPTYAQIAERISGGDRGSVTEEEVLAAVAAAEAVYTRSIDAPLSSEASSGQANSGLGTLQDRLGCEDPQLCALLSHADLYGALLALSAPERRVVVLRFWAEMSQRPIAERLGVSQMHVSRLERRALDKLRVLLREE